MALIVDHELLDRVRREVGDRLHLEQQRRRAGAGLTPLAGMAEQQFARKLIADVIREHAEQLMAAGQSPLDPDTEQALAEGVHASMFAAGRLQTLLNDDSIENVDINGCDEVFLTRAGRAEHEAGDPVASSDAELIELVQSLGAYAGLNSRPWDLANPELDLRLPDGSRLSAVMAVTARPSISIRRHRFQKVELADLVGNGTLSSEAADFLRAIVQARCNVMIAGATRAGKALALDTPIPTPHGWTTMGALCAGDVVFDDQGQPCTVVMAHPVQHGRACFAVEFDTGDVIVADAEHLWEVSSRADRGRQRLAEVQNTGPAFTAEERSLLELSDRAQSQDDHNVTVAQLIGEAGRVWRNSIAQIARTMEPTGATLESFARRDSRPNAKGVLRRPVATYSRQILLKELVARRIRPRKMPQVAQVLTTSQLRDDMQVAGANGYFYNNWQVRLTAPLCYPRREQPLDPYVLGIWLGDGTTSAGEVTTADEWVLTELARLGYPSHRKSPHDPYRYRVDGDLQPKLRALGVLGDKHIPHEYLRGDVEQRRALLQGLLDSDGTTSKSGSIEFQVTHQVLAEQTFDLVCGLGYAAHLTTKQVTYQGRPVGTAWIVRFSTEDRMFRLPRKWQAQHERTRRGPQMRARRRTRTIVAIRPVDPVPVRCITVDSPSHLYLASKAAIPTHNTTLLRAMAAEIPAGERIITVEKALELGLREDVDRHPNCVAMEERLANSEGQGAISMAQLVRRTLRQNPDRVIVGEVLGPEVIDMLNAMGQGNDGSLSTIHARSARDTFSRIATYAIQSSERLPHEATYPLIAGGLDFIVFVSRHPKTGQRRLDSILEVNGFDGVVQANELFRAPRHGYGPAVWADIQPQRLDQLRATGWQQPGMGW